MAILQQLKQKKYLPKVIDITLIKNEKTNRIHKLNL